MYLVNGKESAEQKAVLQTILLFSFRIYSFSSERKTFVQALKFCL